MARRPSTTVCMHAFASVLCPVCLHDLSCASACASAHLISMLCPVWKSCTASQPASPTLPPIPPPRPPPPPNTPRRCSSTAMACRAWWRCGTRARTSAAGCCASPPGTRPTQATSAGAHPSPSLHPSLHEAGRALISMTHSPGGHTTLLGKCVSCAGIPPLALLCHPTQAQHVWPACLVCCCSCLCLTLAQRAGAHGR